MKNMLDIQRMTYAGNIRKLRLSRQLAVKDLARLAVVCGEDIDKIEHGLPVPLEVKIRVLKVLYAKDNAPRTAVRRILLSAQTVAA